jgi:hypothetical protein
MMRCDQSLALQLSSTVGKSNSAVNVYDYFHCGCRAEETLVAVVVIMAHPQCYPQSNSSVLIIGARQETQLRPVAAT